MRQRGEEVVLQPIRLLGLGTGQTLARQQSLAFCIVRFPLRHIVDDRQANIGHRVDRHAPFEIDLHTLGIQDRKGTPPLTGRPEGSRHGRTGQLLFLGTERRNMAADDGLTIATQNSSHRRVHIEEDQILTEQRNTMECIVEDCLKLCLGLPDGILGASSPDERIDGGDEHRRFDRVGQIPSAPALTP